MFSIPSPLVEFMLLGPLEDRRQLQDSPILGDVWVKFGKEPAKPLDLLISPHRDQHAGEVARIILEALEPDFEDPEKVKELKHNPRISSLQGLIVASLTFKQVIQHIVPKTKWWAQRWRSLETETDEEDDTPEEQRKKKLGTHDLQIYSSTKLKEVVDKILAAVREWHEKGTTTKSQDLPALDRFIALTGLLLWARDHVFIEEKAVAAGPSESPVAPPPTPVVAAPQPEGTATPTPEVIEAPTTEGTAEQTPETGTAPPDDAAEASPETTAAPPGAENVTDLPPASEEQPTLELSPKPDDGDDKQKTMSVEQRIAYILKHATADKIAPLLDDLKNEMLSGTTPDKFITEPTVLIWQVSLNRQPMPALTRSIPAVKADAAHTLFKVDCSTIAWAVIDSGIDGNHPAFNGRVKRSYDFKNYRKIVNVSNSNSHLRDQTLRELQADKQTWEALKNPPTDVDAKAALEKLAVDAAAGGAIHWQLVEKFVEIKPGTRPRSNHGTHVAGIIGGNRQAALNDVRKKAEEKAEKKRTAASPDTAGGKDPALDAEKKKAGDKAVKTAEKRTEFADGMCPDIQLYDFRVLGKEIEDWEFAIIAALQFIRYLNDRHNFTAIHGANLSLSIPHDIRNFACGRTPICNECERLVESGVVVVAAAGNHGYKSYETKEGSYESYAAFSITDPGNADSVITVGATHRFWPHTYGVSFFSSRGPTGDGRLKPDLVAPGEKIRAPIWVNSGNVTPGGNWGDLDGTSMAAPHVSGAAAMLMARYSEFIGQPRRIKRILCESATDLGRERSFQGHGMLDVLRAFQSI